MSGRAATDNVIPGMYALSVGNADMPCPPGWAWRWLTDVAQLESGHTPSRNHPEWWGGSVPWIGIKDARPHHGKTIYETIEYTNDDGLANSAARLLPAGTVCLSRTASVGYVVVMGKEMATSQDFVNWICTDAVVPDFLKYLFIAEKDSLLRFSKGTTHSTIYFPEVKAFRACLPPPNEQRRIVAKIEALQSRSDAAKQALDAIPPLLEKLRQSVLAAAFRGDLTKAWREAHPDVEPASKLLERIRAERRRRWEEANPRKKYVEPEGVDAEGLPELPDGWCWASFGELFHVGVGATPSRREESYWGGTIPWVSSGEVAFCRIDKTRESITAAGLQNTSTEIHPPGTVLLGMIGEGKTRGQAAILDIAACNNQNCAAIRVSEAGLCPEYVFRLLEAEYAKTRRIGQGNSQPALNKARVQQIPMPLAPLTEMQEICLLLEGRLSAIQEHGEALRNATVAISRLNQSILAKAFRGELVPQDPSDEPASVLLERIRAEREATPTRPRATKRPRARKTTAKAR